MSWIWIVSHHLAWHALWTEEWLFPLLYWNVRCINALASLCTNFYFFSPVDFGLSFVRCPPSNTNLLKRVLDWFIVWETLLLIFISKNDMHIFKWNILADIPHILDISENSGMHTVYFLTGILSPLAWQHSPVHSVQCDHCDHIVLCSAIIFVLLFSWIQYVCARADASGADARSSTIFAIS